MGHFALFLLGALICSVSLSADLFTGYIESWRGLGEALTLLPDMKIDAETHFDISFAKFEFGENGELLGVEMPLEDVQVFTQHVHEQEGKVNLSFGGATYPFPREGVDLELLAYQTVQAVRALEFDGIDLDIESAPGLGALPYIKALRERMEEGETLIFTVPGQSWIERDLIVQSLPYVDFISFMEYNIWPENDFITRIQDDILLYIHEWGIPPEKIQLGLMPGFDDMGHYLGLQDIEQLTHFAVDQGLRGVMIWDLNRDYQNITGGGPMAATQVIQKILSPEN